MVREVVSAAIRSREKKITANTGPAHILENTIGRLWNTSVGPELGATPKLKRKENHKAGQHGNQSVGNRGNHGRLNQIFVLSR